MLTNREVLVTGGMGFIGSNLCRRLAQLNARVTVVDSQLPGTGANVHNLESMPSIRCHNSDMADEALCAQVLPGKEYIFNIAGQVSHVASMTDPLADLDSNARGQLMFLEACRKYAPQATVVFASTRQIYGRARYLPVDEGHPIEPVDINGVHKYAAEAYHRLFHRIYGLSTVCLRLTNVYGPRMRVVDARQTFLGIWLRRVVEGGEFEVWGGNQRRDMLFIDDAVEAFLAAATTPAAIGGVFNVGGPSIQLRNLAELLIASAGSGSYRTMAFPAERARIDIGDVQLEDRPFRTLCHWEPTVAIAEGLKRSVNFLREHPSVYF